MASGKAVFNILWDDSFIAEKSCKYAAAKRGMSRSGAEGLAYMYLLSFDAIQNRGGMLSNKRDSYRDLVFILGVTLNHVLYFYPVDLFPNYIIMKSDF